MSVKNKKKSYKIKMSVSEYVAFGGIVEHTHCNGFETK